MGVRKSKEELVGNKRATSLEQYHANVDNLGEKIKSYALVLCKDDLLSIKLALMHAVRLVETQMKKNREEGNNG